jgi:hypothetical protein
MMQELAKYKCSIFLAKSDPKCVNNQQTHLKNYYIFYVQRVNMWIKYVINIEMYFLVIYIFWLVADDCSYFSIVVLQSLTMVINSRSYYITGPYNFFLAS